MALDDTGDREQTEARAALRLFRREEGIEDPVENFRSNAGAAIGYAQHDAAGGRRAFRGRQIGERGTIATLGFQRQSAALGHRIASVDA